MSRVAPVAPAETDLLCEGCGYTLTGLPDTSNCPECGKPIAESSPDLRKPPEWELTGRGFVTTTFEVLLHPARFYRNYSTRWGNMLRAARFSSWHLLIVSLALTATAAAHIDLTMGLGAGRSIDRGDWIVLAIFILAGSLITFSLLKLMTHFAAKITAWEAAYRGIRLNYQVVLRGMHYHTAHYLPVAVMATVTVYGFLAAIRMGALPPDSATLYLYTICVEVIIGAIYLFWTYWIGMRNMMYANR